MSWTIVLYNWHSYLYIYRSEIPYFVTPYRKILPPFITIKVLWLYIHHQFMNKKDIFQVQKEREMKLLAIGWMKKCLKKWSLTTVLTFIRSLKFRTHLLTNASFIICPPNASPFWLWISASDTFRAFKEAHITHGGHFSFPEHYLNPVRSICIAVLSNTVVSSLPMGVGEYAYSWVSITAVKQTENGTYFWQPFLKIIWYLYLWLIQFALSGKF